MSRLRVLAAARLLEATEWTADWWVGHPDDVTDLANRAYYALRAAHNMSPDSDDDRGIMAAAACLLRQGWEP